MGSVQLSMYWSIAITVYSHLPGGVDSLSLSFTVAFSIVILHSYSLVQKWIHSLVKAVSNKTISCLFLCISSDYYYYYYYYDFIYCIIIIIIIIITALLQCREQGRYIL